MDVGNFLEFERTFQGNWVANSASDEHRAAAMRHAHSQWSNEIIGSSGCMQDLLYLVRDTFQGREDRAYLFCCHSVAQASQVQPEQVEGTHRGDEGFRRDDADFWACMQVEYGVGQPGDRTGDDVCDSDDWCALLVRLARVPAGCQREYLPSRLIG